MSDKQETPSEKFKNYALGITGVIASIFIPLLGYDYTDRQKEKEIVIQNLHRDQEIAKGYIELGIRILSDKPDSSSENLRSWAVRVINKFSDTDLKFDDKTKHGLIYYNSIYDKTGSINSDRTYLKTLTDKNASKINISSPTVSTIKEIIQIRKPENWNIRSERLDEEYRVYSVTCRIGRVYDNNNGNIYLVLQDINEPNIVMPAEILNSYRDDVRNSPLIDMLAQVKDTWDNKFSNTWRNSVFKVDGVLFFDKRFHGAGSNENGVTLKPILRIKKIE